MNSDTTQFNLHPSTTESRLYPGYPVLLSTSLSFLQSRWSLTKEFIHLSFSPKPVKKKKRKNNKEAVHLQENSIKNIQVQDFRQAQLASVEIKIMEDMILREAWRLFSWFSPIGFIVRRVWIQNVSCCLSSLKWSRGETFSICVKMWNSSQVYPSLE